MKAGKKLIIGITAITVTTLSTLGLGSAQAQAFDDGMTGRHLAQYKQGNADRLAMATSRLDQLKTDLKITADQETAWQTFASKARQQAEDMQAHYNKMRAQDSTATTRTAPERMAQGVEFMKLRLASMETMAQATKDLYAVLTPEQKTVAEQHFARNMRAGSKKPQRPQGKLLKRQGQQVAPAAPAAPAAEASPTR
ncbi:MAG: Spy/CpxP family protein refolding chaperone [Sterolibacterium sp.]|nr:Spy/CpxP family protein refolding chaperone [Sterolibacterium sp.]